MRLMRAMLAAQAPAQVEAAAGAAQPAEVLIGERYRRHVPTRAKKLSGATKVRVIWPGQMVTEDFRPERVNLHVDHRRLITDVDCG